MNKRGQGLSTNAIILIILGVFVLAILILGFTLGWSKIAPWISTTNVDDIVTSCSVACSTNSQFGFCSSKQNLRADGVKLEDVTCNYLAKNQTQYGIETCPQITCDNIVFLLGAGADNLLDENDCLPEHSGKTIQALVNDKLLTFNCPVAP
jgi:hypothetical protein